MSIEICEKRVIVVKFVTYYVGKDMILKKRMIFYSYVLSFLGEKRGIKKSWVHPSSVNHDERDDQWSSRCFG